MKTALVRNTLSFELSFAFSPSPLLIQAQPSGIKFGGAYPLKKEKRKENKNHCPAINFSFCSVFIVFTVKKSGPWGYAR